MIFGGVISNATNTFSGGDCGYFRSFFYPDLGFNFDKVCFTNEYNTEVCSVKEDDLAGNETALIVLYSSHTLVL